MMSKRGPEPRYVGEPLRGLPDWVATPAYRQALNRNGTGQAGWRERPV
jgi:hypothetical protein